MNNDCPTNDWKKGEPQGKCWGDGHHECKNCIHYREDFNRLGQEYIDFAHQMQSIQIITIRQNQTT